MTLLGLGLLSVFLLSADTGVFPVSTGTAASRTGPAQDRPEVDRDRLIRDLSILSHDSMEGRRAGTPGAERARRFLSLALENRGIPPVPGRRLQEFPLTDGGVGFNVLGMIRGLRFPSRYLVVSAHYDHLGMRDGEVYNGADDNASGTAALLAVGDLLVEHPPGHSVVLVAFDAEEAGLRGARAFISDPPVPLDSIVLNINLDMVSHSDRGELYAAGTYHYPSLAPLVSEVAARAEVTLLTGHDSPVGGRDDWTDLSDHGPFHRAGIPFIYFGVEDHADYHRATDTFESVTLDFFVAAVETILDFVQVADRTTSPTN